MLSRYAPLLLPRLLRHFPYYISRSLFTLPLPLPPPPAKAYTTLKPMGSLPSPPPPPPPENPAGVFLICASFCPLDPAADGVSNWLELYYPADNTWRRAGAIPGIPHGCVLKGFAMVALHGFVYVIGGRLCCKGDTEMDVAVRADVLRFDPAAGEWAVCAPLGAARFDFACAACDGKIYVAGGRCAVSRARGTLAAESYDPAGDRWEPLPGMGALRHKCVGLTWRGRFHVVGGFAESAAEAAEAEAPWVERSSAEAFDAGSGEWERMAGMWQLDVPPNQIVAVGERLFSSGDCLNTWKGHVETYDGKLGIWSIVERSHVPDLASLLGDGDGRGMERAFLTMAAIGTRLYFVGGYRKTAGAGMASAAHVFETAGEAQGWSSCEPVHEDAEKELCAHCCALRIH